jgi:hypothetical protein
MADAANDLVGRQPARRFTALGISDKQLVLNDGS